MYICPGLHQCPGGTFSYLVASNEDELKKLADLGYKTTLEAAIKGEDEVVDESKDLDDDYTPPTREELVQKANELEIKFHKNISDAKLLEKINEKIGD